MENNRLIRNLNKVQQSRCLHVQVVRKWSEPKPKEHIYFSTLRMILRDEENNFIDAKGFGLSYLQFFDRIQQYNWYEVKNFIVVPCLDHPLNFPSTVTTNPLIVFLTNETIFTRLDRDTSYKDELSDIPWLLFSRYFSDKSYVFVLGGVYDFIERKNGDISFLITDESNETINCVARHSCVSVMKRLSLLPLTNAPICILRGWRPVLNNGLLELISDPVSEVIENPRTPEALLRKTGIQMAVRLNVEIQNAMDFVDD